MFRLYSILYGLVGPTLAGVLVTVALVAGYGTLMPILLAAAAGFVIGLPVAVFIARRIAELG